MSTSGVSVRGGEAWGPVVKSRGGQWLCLLCPSPTRLAVASSRPWGGGRVCYRCYKRRGAIVATAVVRGGVLDTTPSVSAPELPAVVDPQAALVQEPQGAATAARELQVSSFARYGHAILRATSETQAFAWEVIHLRRPSRGEAITGRVQQIGLPTTETFEPLRHRWEAIVRDAASRVGVLATHLHVVDLKLLVASPPPTSTGLRLDQPVHFDCPREAQAASKFSCLLVCSAGASSTALPRFESNAALSVRSSPAAMQSVASLLQPEHYESVRVHPGDIVFFRQSTPHFGTRNSLPRGDRVMLFSMLSPSPSPGQDTVQVFSWLFIGAAFGWLSPEFARALVENRLHRPVERLALDHGRKARNHAMRCLRMCGLLDAYKDSA